MGNLELKCSFSEELTQILIYPESLMTYMEDPESHSVSVSLLNIQRVNIIMRVKESVALITFTYLVNESITSKCIKTRSNITYREIVVI